MRVDVLNTAGKKIRAAVARASHGDRLGHRSEVALAKICAARQSVRTPKRQVSHMT
jgi:hypothetical protein